MEKSMWGCRSGEKGSVAGRWKRKGKKSRWERAKGEEEGRVLAPKRGKNLVGGSAGRRRRAGLMKRWMGEENRSVHQKPVGSSDSSVRP
ncbi:hypothetical protein VitviT2T_023694 [Vitis vinifera]|uniref:Uncharacterized protein n=1 Tax=Vitis vinifera TaxID=29760 RepID=A0ABY9DGM0_VITVI|nr:hypothetical protein VitviT2T_023694 [Vitis vinifera]